MKHFFRYITLAALTVVGCARTVSEGPNESAKRAFDAWLHVNYPELENSPYGLGIYVIDEQPGTGDKTVEKEGFAIIDMVKTDLDGNITEFTGKEAAIQLGTYNKSYYYGPKVLTTTTNTIQVGLAEGIVGMKVGGEKKFIVPSWLMTYATYDNPADYLNTSNNNSNTIFEIKVRDFTKDIVAWQTDSIGRFFLKSEVKIDGRPAKDVFKGMTPADSVKTANGGAPGFYYKQLTKPADNESIPSDTTVYINYVGKLLNGLVFDTNIEKVAKDNNIWSSSRTYEPAEVDWAEKYSELKLDGNEVISGFALTLWQMKAGEKGVGVFYSPLGYSYSGNGNSIPGYAPLIFEIEMTSKPE